jgi:hypothetical protein
VPPQIEVRGYIVNGKVDAQTDQHGAKGGTENIQVPDRERDERAIVLGGPTDKRVISAPVIEGVIRDQGVIRGGFTLEQAEDLALKLRSGSIPTDVRIIEERTVGPSLGRDSIRAASETGSVPRSTGNRRGHCLFTGRTALVRGYIGRRSRPRSRPCPASSERPAKRLVP